MNGIFYRANANSHAGIVRARQYKDGGLFWSHFDATKRSSIINVDSTGAVTVLAEVTPDAALQKSLEALAKAKVSEQVDAETQFKTITTVAQLGQRTANVNMLRDALYRIAEGANNRPKAFYTCGCPTDTATSEANSTTSKSDSTISKTSPARSKSNKATSTTNMTVGRIMSRDAISGSTMYERLFQATLTTYVAAVNAEASVEKAKAEAEKAKAELEKAKLEAAKNKDKPATDTTAPPKPATASDSTTTTKVSLKLEMLANTAHIAKKEKVKKKSAKKQLKKAAAAGQATNHFLNP